MKGLFHQQDEFKPKNVWPPYYPLNNKEKLWLVEEYRILCCWIKSKDKKICILNKRWKVSRVSAQKAKSESGIRKWESRKKGRVSGAQWGGKMPHREDQLDVQHSGDTEPQISLLIVFFGFHFLTPSKLFFYFCLLVIFAFLCSFYHFLLSLALIVIPTLLQIQHQQ